MIVALAGKIFKYLPPGFRVRLVRATQPKFTVSVGGVVTNPEGRVLLLDHYLRPASGWGIPGGFIDHGEQPEAALHRELKEETGIELENVRMFSMRTIGRHVEIIYSAESRDEPTVRSREIRAAVWCAPDEMPAEMSAGQRRTIERVLENRFDKTGDAA